MNGFVSPFILEEIDRILARKAGWEDKRIIQLRRHLKSFLGVTVPHATVDIIKAQKDDNRILECAIDANADVLVTGDIKHIRSMGSFRGIPILTSREFLDKHFPG